VCNYKHCLLFCTKPQPRLSQHKTLATRKTRWTSPTQTTCLLAWLLVIFKNEWINGSHHLTRHSGCLLGCSANIACATYCAKVAFQAVGPACLETTSTQVTWVEWTELHRRMSQTLWPLQ
jgi:hypothetical protein